MKILIIDDEKLARDIISSQLRSFSNDEILQAENGIKGIEILKKELPDVVFVDIRMPEMSGIELMEKALFISSKFIFIVLSGYNLFEYAQQAIELGAYQYLLKPVDNHKLEATMNAVQEKINKKDIETERFNKLYITANKSKILLRKQYIYEFLLGNNRSIDHSLVLLQENGIYLESAHFKVVFISLQGIHHTSTKCSSAESDNAKSGREDTELIQFAVENIITEIVSKYYHKIYLFCESKMTGILINDNETLEAEEHKEVWEEVFCNVKEFIQAFTAPAEVTIGIGKAVSGLEKVQEAYLSAQEAVKQQIIRGSNAIYYASEEKAIYKKGIEVKKQKEDLLVKFMRLGEYDKIEALIGDLYEPYLQADIIDFKNLNKMHLNLFVLLHKELDKSGMDHDHCLEDEFLLYKQIQRCESIEEMKQYLYEKILNCMDVLLIQNKSGSEKIIKTAKAFIADNLGYELTLDLVASHVGLSSVYFSRLFKNEEGITYMEYITRIKIEKAKECLENHMKTAEICEKIGFRDVKHFYKVFKKLEGISPSQYKNFRQ